MFEPRLRLVPEMDGQFSLLIETDVPNDFYTALKARAGSPKGLALGAHVTAVMLPVRYKPKPVPGAARVIFHRLFNLDLETGSVLKAFVMLDDKILGDVTTIVAAKKGALVGMASSPAARVSDDVELTIELCEAIVVETTPNPDKFSGVATQQLFELGIVDETRARFHRNAIRRRLAQHGFNIDTQDIQSGPDKQVGDCADSVFANATL